VIMLEKYAQKIAESIKEVIGYDVIITNKKSIIIGASDLSRIGTLHERSIKVISSRKPSSEIPNDTNYIGTRPGITFPIELAGKVIGSIAITGERSEVEKYGLLVKKHTEIMLHEEVFLKFEILREQAIQNLIRALISFEPSRDEEEALLARGYELGYDLKPSRIAIAVEVDFMRQTTSEEHIGLEDKTREVHLHLMKLDIMSKIQSYFPASNDITVYMGNGRFVILHMVYRNFNTEDALEKIENDSYRLISDLEKEDINVIIGIGSIAESIYELSLSYKKSWKAIEIGKKVKKVKRETKVFNIGNYKLEELVSDVSKANYRQFVFEVLHKLQQQPDWPEYRKTIILWCESNFMISQASKSLHVHRNTLSYRLNKIYEISGLDLRQYKDAMMLYLAVLLLDLA